MRMALLSVLALAACSHAPPAELPPPELPQRAGVDPAVAARAEGVEYRAVGEGFVLDILPEERIRLTLTATGETMLFPEPEPQYPAWNGVIFTTENGAHALSLAIRDDRPCQTGDAAAFPNRAEVWLDDREFVGCGRRF